MAVDALPTAMQNVADVQERAVSAAGGDAVADAGLADRALAVVALAAAAPAVATRTSAGSAVSSDRRGRDFCTVYPPWLIAFPAPLSSERGSIN
jgi:hypothetical protein